MKTALILTMVLLFINVAANAVEFKRGDNINLTGNYSDTLFVAGRQIQADFNSTDDVFLIGQEIFYSAQTSQNIFLAGRQLILEKPKAKMGSMAGRVVSIKDGQFRDLNLAGGNIRLDNTQVTADLAMAGRDIIVNPNSTVAGSTKINGGNIVFNGKASGDTVINGGDVTLAGTFLGNVNVNGNSLKVAPNTVIGGNLSHAVQNFEISPGANIQGKTIALAAPQAPFIGTAFGIGAAILFSIGMLLVPAILVNLFPRFAIKSRNEVRKNFWACLGKGFITIVLIPPVLFILFASIIGFPIGMAAIPFIAAGIMLGWSVAVFTVGDQLRMWLSRGEKKTESFELTRSARFWWSFFGAFILAVVSGIPIVGFLFSFVLFFAGVGSIYAQGRSQKQVAGRRRFESSREELTNFPTDEGHPSL
ncbi:MAG: hypothetical protein ACXVCY_19095 [Pseudobdellovibrionaceae bacterium]